MAARFRAGQGRPDAGFTGGAGSSLPRPPRLFRSWRAQDWQRQVATPAQVAAGRDRAHRRIRRPEARSATWCAWYAEAACSTPAAPGADRQRQGRHGRANAPCRRSLYRWLGDAKAGFAALAPRDAEKIVIRPGRRRS
ncbi:MAG: hypothetical protein M5R42_16850 [Rhodocyclaceae bacterium]|nr:hypothetical protein [Rhodocyclaceae bacterium]